MPPAYFAAASRVHTELVLDGGNGGRAAWVQGLGVGAGGDQTPQTVADTLAHELTHVMQGYGDEINFWGAGLSTVWSEASKMDGLPTSPYGELNSYEDMAGYGALYFNAWNDPQAMEQLRAASPERFRVFDSLLSAVVAGHGQI